MDLEKYNPFGTFRKYQERVIQEIIEIEETDTQNIILKAPVASGKSLIAYTAARYLQAEQNKKSLIFTSTKLLQDQYLRDFPKLKTVKGRNNFECLNNQRTCDKGSCKEICNFKCPNAIEFRDGLSSLYETQSGEVCLYWKQKTEAMYAPISILNYKFGLLDKNYVHHFIPRDFAIFDEAHNLEKEIMDFYETEVSPNQILNDIDYKININLTDINQWSEEFFEIAFKYEEEAEKKEAEGEKKQSDAFKSRKEKFLMTAGLMSDNPENWVIDMNNNNLLFKPILINEYADSSLLGFGKTRLFMSGSILKNNSFCETLGIEDDYHIIEVPSIISPNNRPIYKEYVGSMSMKNRDENAPSIVNKILEIVARYPNDKGVVHTYTYVIANILQQYLCDDDRFIFHNAQDRQIQTQKFIESDAPKVFVSPYSFEGVDFKGDLARFQIIAKNPFPNMFSNQQYQERDKISDYHWIFEQRCKVLSQMYGRIVRDPNDYGDTYLIDSDIETLLGPSSLVTGYMFEGFVDSWMNKEIIIVDETKLSPDKRKSYANERFNEQIILEEIKKMHKPTVVKLVELYKNLPNDAYKEVRPVCERLLNNKAISLR